MGDTAMPEVWGKLEGLLRRDWQHAGGGTLPIRVMAVDSGYATQDVYGWVKTHPQASWGGSGARASSPRTVVAVKGRDTETALILSVSKADVGSKRRGLRVWNVSGPVAKMELYRWLKLDRPTKEDEPFPPGTCHFPEYAEEYFKQLTAEKRVIKLHKGFPRASWQKDPMRNNEALDCRVYARTAASLYGLDRFSERQWQQLEAALGKQRSIPYADTLAPSPAQPSEQATPARATNISQRTTIAADDPYL
jgi:phage terminase large subunit GpA-like protein